MSSRKPALGSRFADDGRAAIELNGVQLSARDAVRSKLAGGDYRRVRVGCPLCRTDEPIPASEKDMYGLPHPVGVCRRCGFVYTWLRLDDNALGRFYDGEYRQ